MKRVHRYCGLCDCETLQNVHVDPETDGGGKYECLWCWAESERETERYWAEREDRE